MADLREDLEAAGAALADSTSTSNTTPDTTSTPEPTPEVQTATAPSEPGETSVSRPDGRDDKGRFASKTAGDSPGQAAPSKAPPTTEGAASSTPAPTAATPTATPAPKPGEPDTTHAPQSWPLGARTAWEKVPPDVRAVIHRRELETAQALTRSAPDRQLATELRQTMQPIARAIEARGTTPQKLIASYVQFDQALTSRDPATQAHALAQVMKAYGVPVEALADAIDGKGGAPQRQVTIEEIREQARAEERALWQGKQQRAEFHSHASRVQEFAKSVDPTLFNEEIRLDMADFIEAAARRGVELSLQQAYDKAVMANPDARAIVQQREDAKRAATQQQATKRAEAASGSIKSRPASPVGGNTSGNSLRADLEATAASISGRT